MPDTMLENIEAKIDTLISRCAALEKETAELRADKLAWQNERARLIEKNDKARSRVEAMIKLLQNLSTESEQRAS